LSDILAGLRIRAAAFTRMDASAPWGVYSPSERGVNFVLLVRGSAILTAPDSGQQIALRSGDVFIKLDRAPYRLYDHEDSTLIDCVEVEKQRVGHHIAIGGGGAVSTFVSGSFELDALEARPLLQTLPPLLHLKLDQHRSVAFQSVPEMLAVETESPGLGSQAVVTRLFELLFVHAIRAYSMQPGGPTRGWLRAIADRQLAKALEAMHGDPGSPLLCIGFGNLLHWLWQLPSKGRGTAHVRPTDSSASRRRIVPIGPLPCSELTDCGDQATDRSR